MALARAIVYRPQLLLMDEPLSALDKNLREEMQIEIKHLQRELGITVVFVTHDQIEALTMADRVSVLDAGKLQQIGSPRALYEAPETAFVAGFIGENNFWPGVALADSPAQSLAGLDLEGGFTAQGVAATGLRAGGVARLAVWPERVRLAMAGEPGIAGTVQEAIYAGTVTTLLVRTAGPVIRLLLPAGQGLPEPALGAPVALCWRPEDARIFPQAA